MSISISMSTHVSVCINACMRSPLHHASATKPPLHLPLAPSAADCVDYAAAVSEVLHQLPGLCPRNRPP